MFTFLKPHLWYAWLVEWMWQLLLLSHFDDFAVRKFMPFSFLVLCASACSCLLSLLEHLLRLLEYTELRILFYESSSLSFVSLSLILHQSVLTTVSIGEEGRYVAECAHLKCYSDLAAQEHVQTMTFHESLDRSITLVMSPLEQAWLSCCYVSVLLWAMWLQLWNPKVLITIFTFLLFWR